MRLSAGLLLGLAIPAFAGETPSLAAGSRVRIRTSSPERSIAGTLKALDDGSLTVETKNGAGPLVVERSQISVLEVAAHKRSRGRSTVVGAVLGLSVGLLFTAIVGATEDCSGYNAEDCGLAPALSLFILTPALTVSGAAIGAAAGSERWVKVPPRLPATAPAAPPGLRLVLRF